MNPARFIANVCRELESSNDYLERKGICPVQGLFELAEEYRFHNFVFPIGTLVLPLRNWEGELLSAQLIHDREKFFLPGCQISGASFSIEGDTSCIYITEGFATAATVNLATGATTFAAMGKNNLERVARNTTKLFPLAEIVIAADNDCTGDTNPGLEEAEKVALTLNLDVTLPQFDQESGTDFNDLQQLGSLGEVSRQLEANRYVPTCKDPEIKELNDTYAIMEFGSRVKILKEGTFGNSLLSREDFKILEPNGRAERFINSTHRREYVGSLFSPAKQLPRRIRNTFAGYAVEPKEGTPELFMEHLRVNICDSNLQLYEYALGWLANLVQHPEEKIGTALAFVGDQGCGKSTVVDYVGRLLGQHYILVNRSQSIGSRFNNYLDNKLLVCIDEARFNNADHEYLKSLITEREFLLEKKNVDAIPAPAYFRFIVTTNTQTFLRAAIGERRFAVFPCANSRVGDFRFFECLTAEMNGDGPAMLLNTLMNYEYSAASLRQVPYSEGLTHTIINSLKSDAAFLYEKLYNDEWQTEIGTDELYSQYHSFCESSRQRTISKSEFGMTLRIIFSAEKIRSSSEGSRNHIYVFAPIDVARQQFNAYVRTELNWPLLS